MKRILIFSVILMIAVSCKQKKSLPDQVMETLASHLEKIDSSARLDSVRILLNIPVTPRVASIFEDSIFSREYGRIKSQLANAIQLKEKDSIDFYTYEVNVMKPEIDSLDKKIGTSDTLRKFGYLIGCRYYVSRGNQAWRDSTLILLDSTFAIQRADIMDSSLARTLRK